MIHPSKIPQQLDTMDLDSMDLNLQGAAVTATPQARKNRIHRPQLIQTEHSYVFPTIGVIAERINITCIFYDVTGDIATSSCDLARRAIFGFQCLSVMTDAIPCGLIPFQIFVSFHPPFPPPAAADPVLAIRAIKPAATFVLPC